MPEFATAMEAWSDDVITKAFDLGQYLEAERCKKQHGRLNVEV